MWILALSLLICPLRSDASNVDTSLTVGIQSTKTTVIRPLEPLERDIMSVYSLVYESLVTIGDDYKPVGCLAQNWSESNNGRTWTFTLRSGVTFSDGSPLLASDVVATANAILERAADETAVSKGYYGNLSYFVEKISAPDDRTVVVRTKSGRSYYGLLYAMTFPVLPAEEVNQDDPMGSGPYFIADLSPGFSVTLEVNPNWWKATPQVTQITFICHDTQKAVMESYEYGRVNTVFSRSIAAAQYKSGSTTLALDYRTSQLEVLLMNQTYSKLASLNVRLAIRYALDPDAIASGVYMGTAYRTNTPMIPGTWLYDSRADEAVYRDVEKAKQLLEEDGWGDSDDDGVLDRLTDDGNIQKLTLRLLVYEEPDNDVRFQAAAMIKTQLAAVGIDVEIVNVTYPGAQSRLKEGNFHLALVAFEMDKCPDPGFLLTKTNTGNYGRYRSDRMDELIMTELRKTCVKDGDFGDKMIEIQELFIEDCPFICLYYRGGTVLTRYMYTTVRDVREYELLRGIESFRK